MDKTIFDVYTPDEIEDILDRIRLMIEDKLTDKDILDKTDFEFSDELLSIARARIRAEKDFLKDVGEEVFYYNCDDLRFSTPEVIADLRASRLKCKKIVDLCSGIGIQAGAYARNSKDIFAIELDPRKVRYAQENFKDLKNLKFICGDVLSKEIIEQVKDFCPDIIFCDPERLASEKERNLDSIKPGIKKLLEIYSKICPNICLEIPPQMDLEKLRGLGSFEAEYLSLNNKLNRLDLYFGNLKKDERSVVDALSGIRIVDNSDRKVKSVKKPLNYIYEVSDAVIKSGLINEVASLVCADVLFGTEKNKVLLTSIDPSLEFGSFAKPYEIIGVCRNKLDINKVLKQYRFGKVVIKYSVDPKDYWKERNKMENGLFGKREAVVYLVDNNYLVCEFYD